MNKIICATIALSISTISSTVFAESNKDVYDFIWQDKYLMESGLINKAIDEAKANERTTNTSVQFYDIKDYYGTNR